MLPPDASLRIDAVQLPDDYVIRVEGEFDPPGCSELERVLADADRSQECRIVLDLDRLSSINARGLRTLLGAASRSASNGGRLLITRGGLERLGS